MSGRELLPDGNRVRLRQAVALLEGLSDALYAERLCGATVHHFALIRLLFEGAGVELDQEFVMAPSTLSFHRTRAR
jgi:hypothetical protein